MTNNHDIYIQDEDEDTTQISAASLANKRPTISAPKAFYQDNVDDVSLIYLFLIVC